MSDNLPRVKGMRAVILVGGFGTRLRPLTLTKPKPLVPFCNKPIIIHQVEALREAGVTEVILAVAYRPEAMKEEMETWAKMLGVTFVYSVEDEPLGTAGPLALARDILLQDDEPFFVLNSDVTCSFPFQELLAFHRKHGQEGTIVVTKVTEWQKYGVVVFDEVTGQIQRFVEKPQTFVGDKINAGIYVFNKSILDRIPAKPTSIEREIFPHRAAAKQLYAFNLEGFWMDIGQPADYLKGMSHFIPSLVQRGKKTEGLVSEGKQATLQGAFTVRGSVIIHPTAVIGHGCVLGPNVSIGANCKIGPACRIDSAALFDNSVVGTGTLIQRSIIGWGNRIGSWCHVVNYCVLGDDVGVKDELFVNGVRVLPNKDVGTDYHEPAIIM